MADILTRDQRSSLMSKVRSSDTKPEWILRCGLHRLGFRYTLKNNNVLGRPDIVLSKYRAVVFVHGCLWHQHSGCKDATIPKKNRDFWKRKFAENVRRDQRVFHSLSDSGWNVIVVWECELCKRTVETIERVAREITNNLKTRLQAQCDARILKRDQLMKIAKDRVRRRLDSYGKNNE